MRISEEQDRRKRESSALERLPSALEDVRNAVAQCVEAYQGAFAPEAATLDPGTTKIRVITREEKEGRWEQVARIEVTSVPSLPGLQIDLGNGEPLLIEIGLLPGDKLYYRDREKDQYVTMDELTRRILDSAMFPRLSQ